METVKSFCWQFDPLGWPCLSQSEWASWVQAAGSILAILIAIAVPAAQHWLSEQRKKAEALDKARSFGLFIRPAIEAFERKLQKVWDDEDPEDIRFPADIEVNQCILQPVAQAALSIPEELIKHISLLHQLDRASNGVLKAIHCVQSARELTTFDPSLNEPVVFDKKAFYEHLSEATYGLGDCLITIDRFFPRKERKKH